LRERRAHHLRLHAKKHDIGLAHSLDVVRENGNAERFRKRSGFLGMLNSGAGLFAREKSALQKCLKQNPAHLACPDDCDARALADFARPRTRAGLF
jgi:hypothetical protein